MKPNTLGGIALVVAIVSIALNGWLLYDRYNTSNDQKVATLQASFSSMMDYYCKTGGTTSEAEMIALAKELPGAEEAKVETENGTKQLVVGYNPGWHSGWGDVREPLDCSSR